MKWAPRSPLWMVTFGGGAIPMTVRGETSEDAAARAVRLRFGRFRRIRARRIAGHMGEPGGFEATDRRNRALLVFDVGKEEGW